MKRVINYASLLAIAALVWTLASSVSSVAPLPVTSVTRFPGLPIGVRTPVRFSADDLGSLSGTALERRNQLRDWLFYTVVSDADLDGDELSRVLFDAPPLRTGYTEPVAHFEYGATRSRTIGSGEVLALVPRAEGAARVDDLAEVADLEYKTSGVRASQVHVFEYEIADDDDQAWITRLPDVSGDELFSKAYGYTQTSIKGATDLVAFLEDANDITAARVVDGQLVLGGRKVDNGRYRGLRVEDVAALWQADSGSRALQKEIDAFDSRWEGRTYRLESERIALERQRDGELAALQQRIRVKGGNADASGFSLDPVFDYERLAEMVEASRGVLTSGMADIKNAKYSVDDLLAALGRRDAGPLLQTLDQMHSSGGAGQLVSRMLTAGMDYGRFQQARYDGALQGTETGMVLFYTDLLAKLWAMDFEYSAPSARVEDFVSLLHIKNAPIFGRELEELPGTRLWFGPRDDGYQKTGDGVLMARVATRVYAASSNMLKPGEEAEPNASSAAFLWWWNNHYDEVSRVEREYQRLNEIMKWGLILAGLGDREFAALSFLESVPVERTNWFPAWARRHPELTFKSWDKVSFLPRGYKQTTTEAMPILRSRFEDGYAISGGVSLPSRRMLSSRPALSNATDPLLRRSTISGETFSGTGRVLKGFDELTYELKPGVSATERVIVAKPRPAARLRGSDVEIRNTEFQYGLTRTADGLAMKISRGEFGVGDFSVRRVRGGGFQTAFRNHDMERARTLLRVVDDANVRNADVALETARLPGVERVVPADDGGFYVKVSSAQGRWLKIAEEGTPTVAMREGIDLRYSRLGGGEAKRWTAAWVDDATVTTHLGGGEYVRVRVSRNALDGVIAEAWARPPPTGARPFDLSLGSARVKAFRGDDGWTYVARDSKANVWEAMDAARASGSDPPLPPVRDVQRFMEVGDYDGTARLLADHPADSAKILDGYRAASLERARALIAGGRPGEAARELEAAMRLFPDDPQLRLTRAMALIGDKRGASGLNIVGDGLGTKAPNAAPRLREAAQQMVNGTLSDGEAANLATVVRGAELEASLKAGGTAKASVSVKPDRTGQLRMEVRLLDWQAANVSSRSAAGRTVYVEVGTDFDPVIGVQQSAEQLLSEPIVVSQLKSWEIVAAKPHTIVDAKTGVRYARVGRTTMQVARQTGLKREECPAAEAPAATSLDCGDDVYLVRYGAAASF